MVEQTRRNVLIAVAATGVSALLPAPAFAQAARSANPLALPPYPMHLTRRIKRDLKGGKSLIVERDWQIEFMRQGRGISITGSQLSARVDAPAKLASIAAIEEQRSTQGMWPILLSQEGVILATGEYTDPADMNAAMKQAEAVIAAQEGSFEAAKRHRKYLSQMQKTANSLFELLPPDLFFPREPARTVSEYIELPDRTIGEFEIRFEAQPSSAGPWMERSMRQITTRIGEKSRHSIEEWTMARI